MILSDADILDRLEAGDLVVEPIDDLDLQVQPASIDLRLGTEFLEFQRTNISCIHPNREEEVGEYVSETTVPEGEEFILHPGDFVLGTTKERVEIPPDLLATVEGRSSLGRLAVVILEDALQIDGITVGVGEDLVGSPDEHSVIERHWRLPPAVHAVEHIENGLAGIEDVRLDASPGQLGRDSLGTGPHLVEVELLGVDGPRARG